MKEYDKMSLIREDRLHSALKAFSWRAVATLTTIGISYLVTHNIRLATSIGSIEVVSKLILYYIHERAWCAAGKWPKHISD